MAEPNWAAYERCPVCFRSWACVPVAMARRTLGAAYFQYQQLNFWSASKGRRLWRETANFRYLSRPHRGRKRRVDP